MQNGFSTLMDEFNKEIGKKEKRALKLTTAVSFKQNLTDLSDYFSHCMKTIEDSCLLISRL